MHKLQVLVRILGHCKHHWLVVEPPSEKYESVSWDDRNSQAMETSIKMLQTTNQTNGELIKKNGSKLRGTPMTMETPHILDCSILVLGGFSMKSTIQLLGYLHDYGNPKIYTQWMITLWETNSLLWKITMFHG